MNDFKEASIRPATGGYIVTLDGVNAERTELIFTSLQRAVKAVKDHVAPAGEQSDEPANA